MNVNSLEELSKELNVKIKETKEYKEYILNKEHLENNDRLKSIKLNLEKMKHLMCRCDDENIKEEYLSSLKEYEESPLVINYKISEEKLNDMILNIFNIINKGL